MWNERLKQLIEYKEDHGDCLVPIKYEHNKELGQWVSRQRREYKKWLKDREKSQLTRERIDILEDNGFKWEVGKGKGKWSKPLGKGTRKRQQGKEFGEKQKTVWNDRYNQLKKY